MHVYVKDTKLFRVLKGAVGGINLHWYLDEGDQNQNELACFLPYLSGLLPWDVRFDQIVLDNLCVRFYQVVKSDESDNAG